MKSKIKVGSLFSGGGLGDYGLELAGMEIAFQVEIDEYCQKILNLRWPDVPKWKDIKQVDPKELPGVDIISGGFPCQPFSVAGKRKGENDSRDLWKEMFRIICHLRPRWVLAENVPGLLSISNGRKFGEVVRDLASVGYRVEWDCIPAVAIGAPHRRDRIWILGYSEHDGCSPAKISRSARKGNDDCQAGPIPAVKSKRSGQSMGSNTGLLRSSVNEEQTTRPEQFCEVVANASSLRCDQGGDNSREERKEAGRSITSIGGETLGDANGSRKQQPKRSEFVIRGRIENSSWWDVEPDVGRVAHGVANRVDRLKLLGNGQVVQVVQWIGERIIEVENEMARSGKK